MKTVRALMVASTLAGGSGGAFAQVEPIFAPLGNLKAVYYRSQSQTAPHIGVLVMHRTADFLNHAACSELSKRGYLVLCMNSRFENNEVSVSFEKLPLDVKVGVDALRAQPGIRSVLLFGHSGGGPLMSLYQAVAENGPDYCRGPTKIVSCTDELANLPKADGIIFADPHPSNAVLVLRALNPSVANEDNPPSAPPVAALDPFDERNGYNPKGASKYPLEFRQAYYKAQSNRMNLLIETAMAKTRRIAAGSYPYPDNDIMVIPRGGPQGSGPGASAYLWNTDPSIPEMMSTRRPQKLIRNDGSIVNDSIVKSVAVPDLLNATRNAAFDTGTKVLSLRSFLSANAIRSRDAVDDIDFCSSNNSTACAVQSISVPVLFMAMGGYNFIRDNEQMFDLAKSTDKDFAVVEGATHFFLPCKPCEPTPGAYSNTIKNLFDYVDHWANARF